MAHEGQAGNGPDGKRIHAQFEEHCRKAEEMLGDREKTETAIDSAWEKLKSTMAKPILLIREDICLLLDVLKAYITGRYRKIPFKTLAMILGAVTYFSWPFDFIFDLIPVIGFLDDVFVISMVLKFAHDDLQEYKAWEEAQSGSKGTTKPILSPGIVVRLGL
ncbi:hypothetical protein AGMMS49991_11550 [Spirochaetia bacterium]|nr:hypothetical protein AGMMS49991_11550 [Spirochaetia bacterium]